MTNKMTNRKALQYVLDNYDVPADVSERLTAMVKSLDRKAENPTRKPTERQKENASILPLILEYLQTSGVHATCAEISSAVPEMNGFMPQRTSALLKALVTDGKVAKETVKGKTLFYAI